MKKALIIIVIAIIALVLFLNRENLSSYSFPSFNEEKLVSVFKRVKEEGADKEITLQTNLLIEAGADNALNKAVDKVESLFDSAIDNIKIETFKKFKDAVNKKVDDLGKNAGIDVDINVNAGGGSAAPRPPDPVVFTMKSKDPAYFTIVNREDKGLEYEVDWQDGNKDNGTLGEGERVILSHKWSESGEYLIQFKIIKIGEEENYQFLINIF